ncbi:MAG: hypothetical protein KDK91_09420, partial [Gammaproteobacteria bacterium]|nr:hypothetical protein [Gammaproteobacteria bacterium]
MSSSTPVDHAITRHLLGEPLLHFLLLGALLFALDWSLQDTQPQAEDELRAVVIDDTLRAELRERFRTSTGRAPLSAELEQMVEGWLQQEILYREGLSLGLHRSDAVIRDRLSTLVRGLTLSRAQVEAPSEAELREYFEQHRDRYRRPRRYSLEHVLVGTADEHNRAEARRLL